MQPKRMEGGIHIPLFSHGIPYNIKRDTQQCVSLFCLFKSTAVFHTFAKEIDHLSINDAIDSIANLPLLFTGD